MQSQGRHPILKETASGGSATVFPAENSVLRRAVTSILYLILSAACTARSGETTVLAEDLFKWGEYDSLIRLLDPIEKGTRLSTAADSANLAKSYLFLGVAFYATGKPMQADSAFVSACGLDSHVKLDRFYVTEEIANRFQTFVLEGIRQRQNRKALAVASAGLASAGAKAVHAGPSSRPGRFAREGKEWIWWGLGATVLAAGGGALILMNREEPASDNVTTIDARR
jgi:hypothetical protein